LYQALAAAFSPGLEEAGMSSGAPWDAVVIGAGPAGALAARQLALGGRRVLLLDKKKFPRTKVCGACINARAMTALKVAGLEQLLCSLKGLELRQLEIIADGRRAHVMMPAGIAVGRAQLDLALTDAAVQAGCEFRDGTSAKVGVLRDDLREVRLESGGDRQMVAARVVLAADGLEHSSLSGNGAFSSDIAADSLIGLGATIPREGYPLAPGTIRMVAGGGGYVGIVELDGDRLNLAAAVAASEIRRCTSPGVLIAELLDRARVRRPDALASAQWHGTGALTRITRQVACERLFLIGDATGYVEPFTGEGIAWALSSALLVAPLAESCLAEKASPALLAQDWRRLHRNHIQRRQWWCRQVAWVLRTAWRRRAALAAATALPWLARRIAAQINEPFPTCTV
jgi:flavin-dependent dehydrogenase